MKMRLILILSLTSMLCSFFVTAASNYDLEVKIFAAKASERYYKLYNKIAEETYSSLNEDDFEMIFTKLTTVKVIANELVEISLEASEFDLNKVQDPEMKRALQNLRKVGELFVLGEDYFSSVLINLASLKELSTDKDVEPYMGGINMPNHDDSPIAYYPDIQRIFESSNDPDELKYYWETWREKNLVWSSVNFYTIVEAFRKAAAILEVPVLQFWYRCYNHKDFFSEMEKVMEEIRPAYRQIHAFVRHELHKKYGNDVLDPKGPIPDHLFEQVLTQAWKEGSVIETYFPFKELPPYDDFVKDFDARKAIDEVQRFYKSLGFPDFDDQFLNEQLKEHDDTANSGDCRADIFDLTPRVFMKYCRKVDFRKFMQNHGYLSRVHYAQEKKNLPSYVFSSYDLEYPVGEAVILSACTPKHLDAIGLAKDFEFTNATLMNRLFRMGIHTIFNIPIFFVHTKVMNDLLNGTVEMDGINKHYWYLMQEHAGVEPPSDRSQEAIDFPYRFYLDLEQNYQTKKFVSEVLGYQFYRAFCNKSSQADHLHNCDFFSNLAVGHDLKAMMSLGSKESWRDTIAKILPDNPGLHGDALLEYYAPIIDWINTSNVENKLKIGWNNTKKKII